MEDIFKKKGMNELIVTIEKTREWLRVESNEEDALIESFLKASEGIVEGILRYPLNEFEVVPETVVNAVCYIVSNFYEKRESYESEKVIDTVKGMLFAYRKEDF